MESESKTRLTMATAAEDEDEVALLNATSNTIAGEPEVGDSTLASAPNVDGDGVAGVSNAVIDKADAEDDEDDEDLDVQDATLKAIMASTSPTVRRIAEEAQRRADALDAEEAEEDDDDDDYYDTYYSIGATGGGNASSPTDPADSPEMTLEIAEKVFRDVMARCGGGGEVTGTPTSGGGGGGGGGKQQQQPRPSWVRTGAACLLLEQLCAQYPQYVTILTAISNILMKSVYVPDTPEMRHLLGSVKINGGLRGKGSGDASASDNTTTDAADRDQLPADLRAKYGRFLRPYARKTYADAHAQLSEGLVAHAKANRNIELRLTRQTNIFERTIKHWSSSVLRNHFVVWRQHTRRRKQIREKYRTIFGRMRTDECRVKAIRAWRDRAAKMKRLAMFDSASVAELEGIQGSTEKIQEQINALQEYNGNLSSQIIELERDRQVLQSDISAKERVVVELSLRARDMARVGSQLLDTAIVRRPPPSGNTCLEVLVTWAGQMIDSAGGTIDGQKDVLKPLLQDDATTMVGGGGSSSRDRAAPNGPSSPLGGGSSSAANMLSNGTASGVNIPLPVLGIVMMAFLDDRAPSKEQIIQLHTQKDVPVVARDLVNMCTRLISAPSLVTAEQLLTRQRPMLLLFLASLFRHYTNYVVNRPLPNVGGEVPKVSPFAEVAAGNAGKSGRTSRAFFSDEKQGSPPGTTANPLNTTTTTGTTGTAVGGILPEEEDPEQLAAEAVGQWAERVVYQQQWITASMAALHSALDLALQKPIQLGSEEQEDLGKFYNVSMRRLSNILPVGVSDTFYVTFFRALTPIYPDLRKVYSAYATPTLTYHDLIRLLKDCKLLGPKRFQKAQILLLMLEVLRIDPAGFGSGGGRQRSNSSTRPPAGGRRGGGDESGNGGDDDATNTNGTTTSTAAHSILANITPEDCARLELGPAAFTECIIRLALAHTRKTQHDNTILLTSSTIVSNFVLENIVPNALRSDVDRFKHVFRHPLVQAVIARHKIDLRRAFHRYASEDGGEGMSLASFQLMGRDGRWHNKKTITSDVLADVFQRCQQDNGGSFETLDLYEWLEAICALAIYDHPNPLVPLHSKLGSFVEEKILGVLNL